MPIALTRDALARLFPNAKPEIREAIYASQLNELPRFGISTSTRRLAYCLAQGAEESGGFTTFEENLNYKAKRMTQVWPGRFPNLQATVPLLKPGQDAKPLAERKADPVKLANSVYGNRMGNNQPGDGWKYRGQGPIQITGKDNNRIIGAFVGLDLVSHPEWAADREHMMLVFAGYWGKNNLNRFADKGDFQGLTKAINGGLTNLDERKRWLGLVQAELGRPESLVKEGGA